MQVLRNAGLATTLWNVARPSMNADERWGHLQDEDNFNSYCGKLEKWEQTGRDGKRPGRGDRDDGDRAAAEQNASLTTRQVLGFLWPVQLLRERGKDIPKRLQRVQHQGKSVRGVILKEYTVGSIEICSESSKTARQVVAHDDSDRSEEAEGAFAAMQRSVQVSSVAGESGDVLLRRPKSGDGDDEMASILWGDGGFSSNSKPSSKDKESEDAPKQKKVPRIDPVSAGLNGPQKPPALFCGGQRSITSAWLLQTRDKKKGGNEARELEKGKIVLQVQQL